MKKAPGSRREGRTLAVQCLYMLDHNSTPLEEVLPLFVAFEKDDGAPLIAEAKSRAFCESLVRGVVEHRRQIDLRIKDVTQNFIIERIGGIERAILRLGIYEMLHCMETPPVVAINEAVEIAKLFLGDEAGRFVNGVLDRIRSSLKRPARTAAPPATPVERSEQQKESFARELAEHSSTEADEFSPRREEPPAQS